MSVRPPSLLKLHRPRPATWRVVGCLVAAALPCLDAVAADKAPAVQVTQPRKTAQDFQIELRQISDPESTGTTGVPAHWGTATTEASTLTPLLVRVRNGESVRWQLQLAQPMQWTQGAQVHVVQLAASGTSIGSQGSSVSQGIYLAQSGLVFQVTPIASSGRGPIRLDVDIRSQHTQERMTTDLPQALGLVLTTSVSAPLGQWVTLARSGAGTTPGVYRSDAAGRTPMLLQLRVSVP